MQNDNLRDHKKFCEICLHSSQEDNLKSCTQCGGKAHQKCMESVKVYSLQEITLYKTKCEACSSKNLEKECDICCKSGEGFLMYETKEAERRIWVRNKKRESKYLIFKNSELCFFF